MQKNLEHTVMYAFTIAYFIVFIIMLILTITNCVIYIIPMKLQHPQIWGFYLCTIILYIMSTLETAYYIFTGDLETYNTDHNFVPDGEFSYQDLLNLVGAFTIKAIYSLITLTMYHLYLSLAYVNHDFNSIQEMNRSKKYSIVFFWFMIIFIAVV